MKNRRFQTRVLDPLISSYKFCKAKALRVWGCIGLCNCCFGFISCGGACCGLDNIPDSFFDCIKEFSISD